MSFERAFRLKCKEEFVLLIYMYFIPLDCHLRMEKKFNIFSDLFAYLHQRCALNSVCSYLFPKIKEISREQNLKSEMIYHKSTAYYQGDQCQDKTFNH